MFFEIFFYYNKYLYYQKYKKKIKETNFYLNPYHTYHIKRFRLTIMFKYL